MPTSPRRGRLLSVPDEMRESWLKLLNERLRNKDDELSDRTSQAVRRSLAEIPTIEEEVAP